MSLESDNSLLTAVAIAATDASARIQAATSASQIQAAAEITVASTRADADVTAAQAHADAIRDAASTQASAMVSAAGIDAGWHSGVASIEASARTTSSQIDADGQVQAAQAHAQGQVQAAQAQADASRFAATAESDARVSAANIDANARISAANSEMQGQIQSSANHMQGQVQAATTQANATTTAATTDANARTTAATIQANATVQAAGIDAGWHQGVANTEADATRYKADQDLVGVKYSADSETTRLNLKLAFANDKWNALLPIIEEALGIVSGVVDGGSGSGGGIGFHAMATPGPTMGFGGVLSATGSAGDAGEYYQMGTYSRRVLSDREIRMGGGDIKSGGIGFAQAGTSVADAVAGTQLPFINTSGVLTPAQIQQQVNAAYARNDAKTTSETLALVESMSGRGFSANSPILSALRVGLTGQNLRSSILAEQQIRLEAAQANAEMVLNGQKALSDQFIAQEGVLIDKDKNDVTRTVGVLSAISQLIGSAL